MSISMLEILLISIGLSFDVFAVCICEGAMLAQVEKKKLTLMCIIFCLWQLVAVVTGNLITLIPFFASSSIGLQFIWRILSTIIFFVLSAIMIWRALRKESFIERRAEVNFKEVFMTALLVSLDAFFAGIGFGFFNAEFIMVCISLELITILFCILGVYTGYRLGYEQKQKALLIGGIILFIASIEILVRFWI